MKKLILASASPWRRTLMERTRIPFVVEVSDFEEDITQALPPRELVQKLALGKAESVAIKHTEGIVIGADTLVEWEGKPLGKPLTPERAKEMLTLLNNKTHPIHTGLCIIDAATGRREVGVETTLVTFRNLSEAEIDVYIATEEALTVAGGYAIQGDASSFMKRIEGDFYTIVGLPLARVVESLAKFDIHIA